jgi:aspartate/methionine/tyrosine aminotransferase
MKIEPFAIERYFAKYEFSSRYLLSCSDCEPLGLAELLAMSNETTAALWENLTLAYTESAGHPLLRAAIAGLYRGMEIDDVLVTVPEEGIFLLMQALLEPGDHVVCTFPAYQSLYQLAQTIGCKVTFWKPEEETGWRFDPQQLAPLFKDNTKLVVVNFPHNPTGYLPSREDYLAIIDTVRGRGVHLLSDEMYRFIETEEGTTLPAGCECYEKAVSLGGLSKSFGLPGLRLGWVASKDEALLRQMGVLKDYTTICASAPSEILALMALDNREEIIAAQKARIRGNLETLGRFFEDHGDCFSWNRPGGGSICFPRMVTGDNTYAFCEELVKNTGIMLLPSRMFQFGDSHVRIGFGRTDLPEVLDRFGEYLTKRFQKQRHI